jgi:3-oxocholest-4-en-26-oate---CoA ligase
VPRSVWLVEQISRTPAGKADYRWARSYADEQMAAAQGVAAGASPPAEAGAAGSASPAV